MPLHLQAKLLRVLQEKQVIRLGGFHPINLDVRIIAATNQDLEKMVQEKKFRLDLFYRLNHQGSNLNHINKSAKNLGISRASIYNKIKEYNISI